MFWQGNMDLDYYVTNAYMFHVYKYFLEDMITTTAPFFLVQASCFQQSYCVIALNITFA